MKQAKHNASDYRHIQAWGRFMGSYQYYIENEQAQAARENAPLDAIYERDGVWSTFAEVKNDDTRKVVESYLHH